MNKETENIGIGFLTGVILTLIIQMVTLLWIGITNL